MIVIIKQNFDTTLIKKNGRNQKYSLKQIIKYFADDSWRYSKVHVDLMHTILAVILKAVS